MCTENHITCTKFVQFTQLKPSGEAEILASHAIAPNVVSRYQIFVNSPRCGSLSIAPRPHWILEQGRI